MKILLFIDSLCSGGAQRQLVGLSKLLKEKSYDVTIMTYHKDEFYLPFLVNNGITYRYISKAENKKTRIFHIIRQIKKENPDVLISFLSTPNILSCIAKCFIGKMKLIVSERNTTQYISLNEKIRFFLYRYANVIVPNSYSQEEFIKQNYPHLKEKIKTITNFVDINYFKPLNKKQQNNIPTIISVGRITPQKNILNYLASLKLVVDKGFTFKAIWYGNTDRIEYYNACKSKIEELELNNYFEFRPATKFIRDEYQKNDIFCLPSIFEGFPNVLCEAMSCALPVICSDVCDNYRIVGHERSGILFNPNKVDEIANAIAKMLNYSSKERESMGDFNRKRSIEMFSENTFIEKYLLHINC